ncbi:potassium channel family protein [Delftia lacustris]|uniref:potassium channel family protein n=1 Tax=Delftia lacustris TaxID=558537 RepID=UPI002405236E|nr:potassium channel family protein [Delftia lacustris]
MSEPHSKGVLTSRLGRITERASYVDLFLATGCVLLLGSFYYLWIPMGNGLASNGHAMSPDFFEALYFCIVTFTTLGYGDLSPIGTGRFVASLIVMSGLALAALLIGKFASERQQSTLLLLYTSDAQRRLESFTGQIEKLRTQLECWISGNRNGVRLAETLQSLENLIEATFSYVIFNANQARLVEFGNASALKSLYRELAEVQVTCATIHKYSIYDVEASDCALALAIRLSRLMNVMQRFHRKIPESYTSMVITKVRNEFSYYYLRCLTKIYSYGKQIPTPENSKKLMFKKKIRKHILNIESSFAEVDKGVHIEISRKMDMVASDLNYWVQRTVTPAMLYKVLKLVPPGRPNDWPKNLNTQIGEKLKINNSLARRCIEILRQQNRLPKT